ncbi:MAG TPA: hypothetical protein VEB40_00970 [Flavipsychrobacter sp.]|nr:hypothetical protein [Flavipsychrobacter sp.]
MATVKETLEAEVKAKNALITANSNAISSARNSLSAQRSSAASWYASLVKDFSNCVGFTLADSVSYYIDAKILIPDAYVNKGRGCSADGAKKRIADTNYYVQRAIDQLEIISNKTTDNELLNKQINELQDRINELPESKQAIVAANTIAQTNLAKEQGKQRVITIVAVVLGFLIVVAVSVWWFKFRKK